MIYPLLAEVGNFGDFICHLVEIPAELLPQSPITFASSVEQIAQSGALDFVGSQVVMELFEFMYQVGGAVAIYKVIKIMPGLF